MIQETPLPNSLNFSIVVKQGVHIQFTLLVIHPKEIVERRHGEPIKFLFLPKMGLLGSQAGNEKNCWL